MIPKKAEIVIIGGGVIGASIAYYLAKEKVDVVLLERDTIASGTSGACSGGILLISKKPGIHLELAIQGAAEYKTLMNSIDRNKVEYAQSGGMAIIENEIEWEFMKELAQKQRENGLDVELLNKKETRKLEPSLSQNILGSTYSKIDADVNPMLLTLTLVEEAKRLGAKISKFTEVLNIDVKSNKIRAVRTNKGVIETRFIVNAAGVYSAEIGKLIGVNIPIYPLRGQVLVTEQIPRLINGYMMSAKGVMKKFIPYLSNSNNLENDISDEQKYNISPSIHQTVSGNVIIGITRELAGFDRSTNYRVNKYIAKNNSRLVPALREVNIIRSFTGLRPYTPDGLPILGKVPFIEGFILALGHGGDGISLAPMTGKLISDLILRGSTSISLDEFAFKRFQSKE